MVRRAESGTLRAGAGARSGRVWGAGLWSNYHAPIKRADRIVVEKSARTMKLMLGTEVLKTYKVALSREPVGAKEREGDHRVPEGLYVIDSKNSHSRFHLALHISYPNANRREKSTEARSKAGGDIRIHGLVGSTVGSVACTPSGLDRRVHRRDQLRDR